MDKWVTLALGLPIGETCVPALLHNLWKIGAFNVIGSGQCVFRHLIPFSSRLIHRGDPR
ncbi:MAG: hypothetical protein V2G42_07140 [bacterium JZ-2024 1]